MVFISYRGTDCDLSMALNLSPEEREEVQANLKAYLEVVYRIFEEMEAKVSLDKDFTTLVSGSSGKSAVNRKLLYSFNP